VHCVRVQPCAFFLNVVCISWKIKCWILLMHGVTMKFIGQPLCTCGVVLFSQDDMRVYLASDTPAAATAEGEMILYCDIACLRVCCRSSY